jgi:hypothetical protein
MHPCSLAIRGLTAGLVSAVLAPAVFGGQLDLGRVPAGAVWLMHADMDAARESSVVRRMYERMVKKHPEIENMAGMVAAMTGMDPRTGVHDATAYGLDTNKRHAVMIVHADVNRGFLEKMVAKARDHETMKHRDYVVHSWKDHHGKTVFGAFFKDDMLVFAHAADRVKLGLDVLDGKADSADAKSPLAGRTRPGSILVARASQVDPETKCPVLRQGEGFRVAMGEHDGASFYRARLDMDSAEAADLAEDVVEGMAATVRLGLGAEPGVPGLVDGLKTTTKGSICQVAWDASADDVWKTASALADKIEVKIEAHVKAKRKAKACGCGTCGCSDCGKEGCGKEGCESGRCPLDTGSAAAADESDARRPFDDDEF